MKIYRFGRGFAMVVAAAIMGGVCLRSNGADVRVDQPNAAAAIAAAEATSAKPIVAQWQPQTAPGSVSPAAPDARRQATLLDGWQRIPLAGSGQLGRAVDVSVPDEWSRGRDFQRAWYVARIDIGHAVPPSTWLRFDAVASRCEVFVNGTDVGGHIGGFTPFELEVTRALTPHVNTVAIYVRDEHAVETTEPPRAVSQLGVTRPGAFVSFAGIRGGVFLEARLPVHVDHVLVHTSTRRNEIEVSTWLRGATANATITHAIYAWPDGTTPVKEFPPARIANGTAPIEVKADWADALRWSPEHPNLYTLRTTVRAGEKSETIETRFGFREFWTEGRSFILNGTPTHLLGTSVATDMRSAETPDVGRRYARDALLFLKREFNYRAMRLHASIQPRYAVQAADEAGVLLIDQSGIWSAMGSYYQRGGDEFMRNMEREFGEWFWRDANNPAVVIFDVENEMIRDQRTPDREKWVLALDRFIKQHDSTRVVEHAGAAWYAPTQEVIHLHMQEQYAEPLRLWSTEGRVPLIVGEFWVGGRGGETRLPDGYEFSNRLDWLQDESRQYREKILEMRWYGASGVMPFWLDRLSLQRLEPGIRHTYDPKSDKIYQLTPGLRNLGGEALAPVIAFVWPRGTTATAGQPLTREVVVCNDREQAQTLSVVCDYAGQHQEWKVALPPSGQDRHKVQFSGASAELSVRVSDATGQPVPGDTVSIHAIPAARPAPASARRIIVAPAPPAETARALQAAGLKFEAANAVPGDAVGTLLLVPPGAPRDAFGRNDAALVKYLTAGGRLLVLNQTEPPLWLPLSLPFWPSLKKSAPEFTLLGWPEFTRFLLFSREVALYAPSHPAFADLRAADLAWWSQADGRVCDDAWVRPSALASRAGAPYRVLAGAARRENASLIEATFGPGTAVFCQLQLLQPHPAARALLGNLVRYLDGPAWQPADAAVGIVGDVSAARLAGVTGLSAEAISMVTGSAPAPHVVLAGDRADPNLLDALARGGHRVIVLSRETANRFPGYAARTSNRVLCGTRGGAQDDPLFWGVASGSFLPLDQSPAKGVLTTYPSTARIVLGALSAFSGGGGRPRRDESGADRIEMMDGDRPLAVTEQRGDGVLVVTTLEPWNPAVESHRQLLATLLANAGVRLPVESSRPEIVAVKSTVPLRLDGRLDDWTNDMEDRNVSQFQHAAPIVLTSRDAVAGKVAGDNELSAVVYLLHDASRLYVGGVVFASEPPRLEIEIAGHKVEFELTRAPIRIDGTAATDATIATGRQPARDLGDTRMLTLTTFNAQIGSMSSAPDLNGRTFEVSIPLPALKLPTGKTELPARIRVSNASGATLQAPPSGDAMLTVRML